jgi:hypothetical protein
MLLHPQNGLTGANIGKWLGLAKDGDGEGSRAWQQATSYLKGEGFVLFAGARPVDSLHQWAADVEGAWRQLRNPNPQWWAELQQWCNSTQFRARQDMAFHDQQLWISVWVLRDPPNGKSRSLACYECWLQYQEDLDIGYLLANPGKIVVFRLARDFFSHFDISEVTNVTMPMVVLYHRGYGAAAETHGR